MVLNYLSTGTGFSPLRVLQCLEQLYLQGRGQSLSRGIKPPGHEADCSPPFNVEVKNA
jgi:hypothetical protein